MVLRGFAKAVFFVSDLRCRSSLFKIECHSKKLLPFDNQDLRRFNPPPTYADVLMSILKEEVSRRRTFAIISHPDAGKTTLTERLLVYGGATQLAGTVKARKASRYAVSDWMELEKKRGISVTSAVMTLPTAAGGPANATMGRDEQARRTAEGGWESAGTPGGIRGTRKGNRAMPDSQTT